MDTLKLDLLSRVSNSKNSEASPHHVESDQLAAYERRPLDLPTDVMLIGRRTPNAIWFPYSLSLWPT